MQFSALFSYMLWHTEFKFCIWLFFNVPQSKFEFRHFASIFVGVMPLCELRILEIHSFPHFSLTCFDILSSNFAYDCFTVTVLQIKFECRLFASIFVGVMPLFGTKNTGNTQFSALFSHTLQHIELKVCILLCFSELQIKFECRQFASILELCLFSNLECCKYSFLQFPLTRFDILSWNFAHYFVLLYYRSTSSVVNGYQFL